MGEVTSLELSGVTEAIDREVVPVISPIAQTEEGIILNVNADVAAGAMAGALKAAKMIYVSDVMGVMRNVKDPSLAHSHRQSRKCGATDRAQHHRRRHDSEGSFGSRGSE